MKKKVAAAFFIAAIGIMITACSGTQNSTAQESAGQNTTETAPALSRSNGGTEMTEHTVTVSGTGRVDVTPDKAQISVGVFTEAETAKESQEQNAEKINAIIEKLKETGVPESSIQTTGFYMNQNYDYNTNRVIGYRTEATLTVSDREIDEIGTVISACTEMGANNFNGISFTSSKYDEAYGEALGEAVAEARTKAEALAAASGKKLGSVMKIVEGYQDTSARYRNSNIYMESPEAEEAVMDMAVMPGELSVNAPVTVTFLLED